MERANRGLTSYRLGQLPEQGLKVLSVRKLLLADIKTMKQTAPFKLLPVGRYAAMCIHTYTIANTQFREGAIRLEATRDKNRVY